MCGVPNHFIFTQNKTFLHSRGFFSISSCVVELYFWWIHSSLEHFPCSRNSHKMGSVHIYTHLTNAHLVQIKRHRNAMNARRVWCAALRTTMFGALSPNNINMPNASRDGDAVFRRLKFEFTNPKAPTHHLGQSPDSKKNYDKLRRSESWWFLLFIFCRSIIEDIVDVDILNMIFFNIK